jgi:hypothetical protein
MLASKIRCFVVAALAAGAGQSLSGCVVEGPPPAYAEGYEPVYYDGYVVYYDGYGRPYYYANGAVLWVPPTAAVYPGLVAHWHTYGPAYSRWYARGGYRYRGYRGRR